MENVLTALIATFIILFAVLTLSDAFTDSQDHVAEAWQDQEDRAAEQRDTRLTLRHVETSDDGAEIIAVLRSEGASRLADFDRWDVIVRYYDDDDPATLYNRWLPYTAADPIGGEWTVDGIYLDDDLTLVESLEPDILNPGELLAVRLRVVPPVGPGRAGEVLLATPTGVNVSFVFTGNQPPALTANETATLPQYSAITLDTNWLSAEDPDDSAEDLTFQVSAPPAEGTLEPADRFTQADVEAGRVRYTHTGAAGVDGFTFTVTDGDAEIGPFAFSLDFNAPPTLQQNTPLNLTAGGMATITNTLLRSVDIDDTPDALIYELVVLPSHGYLNLGSTFTQADIDAGTLTYFHTGSGETDSFQFTVTDGQNTLGVALFMIQTTPPNP
ncbi:MAG: cadherin-like domain-containing protein [Chloroflexota bacterium]